MITWLSYSLGISMRYLCSLSLPQHKVSDGTHNNYENQYAAYDDNNFLVVERFVRINGGIAVRVLRVVI
jgi:hypothetical protein